jgi:hypothetical protein
MRQAPAPAAPNHPNPRRGSPATASTASRRRKRARRGLHRVERARDIPPREVGLRRRPEEAHQRTSAVFSAASRPTSASTGGAMRYPRLDPSGTPACAARYRPTRPIEAANSVTPPSPTASNANSSASASRTAETPARDALGLLRRQHPEHLPRQRPRRVRAPRVERTRVHHLHAAIFVAWSSAAYSVSSWSQVITASDAPPPPPPPAPRGPHTTPDARAAAAGTPGATRGMRFRVSLIVAPSPAPGPRRLRPARCPAAESGRLLRRLVRTIPMGRTLEMQFFSALS